MFGVWKPIETAPRGELILVAFSMGGKGDDGKHYDYLVNLTSLLDGRWVEGPGPQPDYWMELPLPPKGIWRKGTKRSRQ